MIRIYGASDDLVEVEGDIQEEIGCYDRDVHFIVGRPEVTYGDGPAKGAAGIRVWMHYTDLGVWSAQILQIEEGIPIPWPVRVGHAIRDPRTGVGYSVVVDIDCPKETPVTWQVVDSADGGKQ